MGAIRAAVLTVRTIDYSRLIERLVIGINLVAGTTAVLLACLVAVAIGLN